MDSSIPKWPSYTPEEIKKVEEIIKTGNVNYLYGSEGKAFENEFSRYVGTNYAICIANGSLALTAALNALNIGEGDEVITTPRTFVATASCIVLTGAKPVFADIDRDSGNITDKTIRQKITSKTKAIVVVHLAGWPADMNSIKALATEKKIKLIEDCAQAHGAEINGKSVGSFGDVAAWSFCTDKIISTLGEGGMITTNDEKIWQSVWSYKDHGKSYDSVFVKKHPPGFRWLHDGFGNNFRLTEIQCAVGRIQLSKLKKCTEIRERNAMILKSFLDGFPSLRIPITDNNTQHAWYRFYAYVESNALLTDWSRDRILAELNRNGVPAFSGSCSEIYLENAFKKSVYNQKDRLDNAKELGETSLAFFVHQTISKKEMDYYAENIQNVIKKATK